MLSLTQLVLRLNIISLLTVVWGFPGICKRQTQIRGARSTCVDVPSQDNVLGKDLQIWGCQNYWDKVQNKAQVFTLRPNGELLVMGKCLDIEGPSTANGAKAQIWDCVNVPQQKFEITVGGEIYNRWADKCLTASGTSWKSGLTFRNCDGRASQRWAFPQIPSMTKVCNGEWVEKVTYKMSSCGLEISLKATKKAKKERNPGWSDLRKCKPACFEVWTFSAGVKSWHDWDPRTPAIKSIHNQAVCHARCDKFLPFDWGTGPTWDLESWNELSKPPPKLFGPGTDAAFCFKTRCAGKSLWTGCKS